MIKDIVEQDVWEWIKNYIEANHKFYDYKFPPCPYAKSARLKGLVTVHAYESGSIFNFIKKMSSKNIDDNKHSVMVLVLPPRTKLFNWFLSKFINNLNKKLVQSDYYAQYGVALSTESKYAGFLNSGEYSIVIINKLSEILDGHKSLLKTDYYKSWAKHHYDAVVVRRQDMYDRYGKK
jgi:hypothetical protein